jgi:hypothetical protein
MPVSTPPGLAFSAVSADAGAVIMRLPAHATWQIPEQAEKPV